MYCVTPAIQSGTRGCCTPAPRRRASAELRHRPALEHRHEHVDARVEGAGPGAVVGRRLVEQRVLAVAVHAEAEGEHDAAGRQPVERRGLLGDQLHAAPRQRQHHRADAHPLRGHGDRRQRHPRIGERLVRSVPQVVPHEQAVPAGRLGGGGDVGDDARLGELLGERQRQTPTHQGTVATGAGSVVGRMERFGLVGLPNAGKSSLYNALTGGGALAAPYAFATKDPNIGVAKVPDERLDRLAEMSSSRNIVHAAVQVVDIGGLVEGASKGEGLGNKFLANIREVDAIVLVLRAFEDDDVIGPSDPLEHLRVVELELALADLETVEKRLHQAQRQAKLDRSLGDEVAALQVAYDALSEGRPLYRAGLNADQRTTLAPHFLLTNRRVLAVVNVGEDELDAIPDAEARVAGELSRPGEEAGDNVEIIGMCVQLEAEAASIEDPVERAEMLEGFGLGEGALFRMVRSAYHLLGLRTFLTTGDKESRSVDLLRGLHRAAVRRTHPHRLPAWLHPRRGHPVGRTAHHRLVDEGQGAGQDPPRGQGLHRQRRRRDGVQVQRLTRTVKVPPA